MLLFCPDCQAAFTGVSRCPRCSGLLLMPEETPQESGEQGAAPVDRLHPTLAGRIAVGTVLSLGLYLGLSKFTIGGTAAVLSGAESWWLSADALVAVFLTQMTAVAFGAVLAAAGRRRGIALGSAVGALCGGLFLAAEVAAGASPTQLVLLLQPVFLLVTGAIAGALGSWYWRAVPDVELPPPLVKKSSSIELLNDTPKEGWRPTMWTRILIGALVLVCGMTLAESARQAAEKASGGLLKVSSRGQGKFMSWQIATLAVLAGGAIAGAGTGAGVRHGILTGLLGGIGLTILGLARGELSQPEEYLLRWMNLAVEGPRDPVGLLGISFGVLIAAMVGGWFGGQLFLPLAPAHMRRRSLSQFS